MPPIAIDGYRFLLLNALDKYIDSLPHGKQQFSTEQQGLEFYATYAGTVVENSAFAKKVKDRGSWKAAGCSEDLDELTKPIRDHNVAYQQTKDNREVAMTTIEEKWGKATADYIRGCNASEKYAKAVRKAANRYN